MDRAVDFVPLAVASRTVKQRFADLDVVDVEERAATPAPTRTTLNITRDFFYAQLVTGKASIGTLAFDANAGGRRAVVRTGAMRARQEERNGVTGYVGAAVYLDLAISNFDASAKLTLPFLAAQAEVGLVQIAYQMSIEGYTGDTSPYVLGGTFNVEEYVRATTLISQAKKKVLNDFANIDPVPLGIIPQNAGIDVNPALVQAVATRYALQRIADGEPLQGALSRPQSRYLTEAEADAVRQTYADLGVKPNERPTTDVRSRALSLLVER